LPVSLRTTSVVAKPEVVAAAAAAVRTKRSP
jgi:hypothetical protein